MSTNLNCMSSSVKRKRRASLLLGGARKSKRKDRIFEYFFVIGTNEENKPTTLFQYPKGTK